MMLDIRISGTPASFAAWMTFFSHFVGSREMSRPLSAPKRSIRSLKVLQSAPMVAGSTAYSDSIRRVPPPVLRRTHLATGHRNHRPYLREAGESVLRLVCSRRKQQRGDRALVHSFLAGVLLRWSPEPYVGAAA